MNRRSFFNRLFLFTGALSSGLWVPRRDWKLVPWWYQEQCIKRIYTQAYLEAMYNNSSPLNFDKIARLFYALKRARDERGLTGRIVIPGVIEE